PLQHVPQSSVPPHPSGIVPQFFPCAAHVVGVQPQTFAVPPPPHVCGAVHVPQSSVPLHPFGIVPQSFPCAAHVVGVQRTARTRNPAPCLPPLATPPLPKCTCHARRGSAATVEAPQKLVPGVGPKIDAMQGFE